MKRCIESKSHGSFYALSLSHEDLRGKTKFQNLVVRRIYKTKAIRTRQFPSRALFLLIPVKSDQKEKRLTHRKRILPGALLPT